jgi:hypothetical protein
MIVDGMKQLDKAISLVDGCPEDPVEVKIRVDYA